MHMFIHKKTYCGTASTVVDDRNNGLAYYSVRVDNFILHFLAYLSKTVENVHLGASVILTHCVCLVTLKRINEICVFRFFFWLETSQGYTRDLTRSTV